MLKNASKVRDGVLLWHFYISRRRISSLAWSDPSMGLPLCLHCSSHCAEKTKSLPKCQKRKENTDVESKILTGAGSVFVMRQVRQRWGLGVYLSKTREGTFLNHFTTMPSRQLEIFTRCFQPQSQYLPYIRKTAHLLPGILSFTFPLQFTFLPSSTNPPSISPSRPPARSGKSRLSLRICSCWSEGLTGIIANPGLNVWR